MIKIKINTPDGEVFDGEYEYAVIRNQEGEFAILKDHIPIVSTVDFGYLKFSKNTENYYALVLGGIVEFSENNLRVLAQEAELAESKEQADKYYEEKLEQRREENRKRKVDYTQAEIELKKGIKAIGASKIK